MPALGPRPRDLAVPSEHSVVRRVQFASLAVFAAFLLGSAALFAGLFALGDGQLAGLAFVFVLAAYGATFGFLLWKSSQRELALIRTNSLFLQDLPVGILFVDPAANVTYANPALQRITGLSSDDVVGRSAAAFVHPDDRARVARELLRRARGEVSSYELRVLHANGSTLNAIITAIPFMDGDTFDGSLAVVSDVTEVLEMRARAAHYQDLSAFALDAVTHDLSNRMQEVVTRAGLAGVLVPPDAERAKAAIAAASAAAERAARLIKEVKQIAAAERQAWPKREVDVPALIDRALVIADIPEPLRVEAEVAPQAALARVEVNDLAPLVLSKLLEQAAEGARVGPQGPPILLQARLDEAPARQVVLTISGFARKVSDDDLKLMLAPLREAGAGETPWRSGVKLALASAVAEAHGWGLRAVRASDGEGAVFEVHIPLPPP